MKNFSIFSLFFLFLSNFISAWCNVPQSNDGVFPGFQSLQQGRGIDAKSLPSAIFEKDENGVDSNVFDINGLEQFERIIIKNSCCNKPVVLKLYLPTHKDINKVHQVFQSVAQSFNNKVVFAGLNVAKNVQLYMRIHSYCNLKNAEMPLFLFYEKGQLKMPFLTGFQHKDYFVEYIQRMFFNVEK